MRYFITSPPADYYATQLLRTFALNIEKIFDGFIFEGLGQFKKAKASTRFILQLLSINT